MQTFFFALIVLASSLRALAVRPCSARGGWRDDPPEPEVVARIHLTPRQPDYRFLDWSSTDSVQWENGVYHRARYFEPNGYDFSIWRVANGNESDTFSYDVNSGEVMVAKDGLYMIYSQMFFYGERGSQIVKITDVPGESRSSFIKCITPFLRSGPVGTCHTNGVTHLSRGQKVHITLGYPGSLVGLNGELTNWGMVKLGSV